MWKPTCVVDCRNGKAIFGRVSYSRLIAIHRFRSKIKMIAKSLTQSPTQRAQTYTSTYYFHRKRFSSQSLQHSRHLGNISHKAVSPSRNSSSGPLARPNLSLNRFPVFSVCFSFFFWTLLPGFSHQFSGRNYNFPNGWTSEVRCFSAIPHLRERVLPHPSPHVWSHGLSRLSRWLEWSSYLTIPAQHGELHVDSSVSALGSPATETGFSLIHDTGCKSRVVQKKRKGWVHLLR